MNLFNRRKKNERTIEEQNNANQDHWKKHDVVKNVVEFTTIVAKCKK